MKKEQKTGIHKICKVLMIAVILMVMVMPVSSAHAEVGRHTCTQYGDGWGQGQHGYGCVDETDYVVRRYVKSWQNLMPNLNPGEDQCLNCFRNGRAGVYPLKDLYNVGYDCKRKKEAGLDGFQPIGTDEYVHCPYCGNYWMSDCDWFTFGHTVQGLQTGDPWTHYWCDGHDNVYNISYDANGGTGSIDSSTATYNQYFTLSSGSGFTREGYTLDHWSVIKTEWVNGTAKNRIFCKDGNWHDFDGSDAYATNPDNWKPYDKNSTYKMDNAWIESSENQAIEFTFCAQWKQNTYTIQYDHTTGQGDIASTTTTYGGSFTLAEARGVFVKVGEHFDHYVVKRASDNTILCKKGDDYTWREQSISTNDGWEWVWYYPGFTENYLGDAWINPDPSVQDDTFIFHAQYADNTYTIAYDGNGATGGSMDSKTVAYRGHFELDTNGFSKTNWYSPNNGTYCVIREKENKIFCKDGLWHKFDGTDAYASNAANWENAYTAGYSSDMIDAWISSDPYIEDDTFTFYVQWKESLKYTINYVANGGSGSVDSSTLHSGESFDIQSGFTAPAGQNFKGYAVVRASDYATSGISQPAVYSYYRQYHSDGSSTITEYAWVTVDKAMIEADWCMNEHRNGWYYSLFSPTEDGKDGYVMDSFWINSAWGKDDSFDFICHWTSDSLKDYTINYYFMDENGNYPSSPDKTESGTAYSGATVQCPLTDKDPDGNTISDLKWKSPAATNMVISSENDKNVCNYYFERKTYALAVTQDGYVKSTSVNIGGTNDKKDDRRYYWGQKIKVSAVIKEATDQYTYSFVNWTSDNFDTSTTQTDYEITMPAANAAIKANGQQTTRTYTVNCIDKVVDSSGNVLRELGEYGDPKTVAYNTQARGDAWGTAQNYGSNYTYKNCSTENVTGNTTVHRYFVCGHTVTTSSGTGIKSTSIHAERVTTKTVYEGDPVSVSAEVKDTADGMTYAWKSWSRDSGCTDFSFTQGYSLSSQEMHFTMPNGDVSLTAEGTESVNSYEVKVNHYVMTTYGSYDDTPDATDTLTKQQYGTVKNHSELIKSSLLVSGGIEYDAEKSKVSTTVTGDVTISLYYKRVKHKVILNVAENGGSWSGGITKNAEAELYYNAIIPLTDFAGLKDRFEFAGWNQDMNATEGQSGMRMGTSDMTFYAVYSREIVTTFVDCNGSTDVKVTIYNKAVSGNINAPGIAQYHGWEEASNSKIVGYNSNKVITKINGTKIDGIDKDSAIRAEITDGQSNVTVTDSKTYYAVYSADVTLSYELNGGDANDTTTAVTKTIHRNAYDLSEIKGFDLTLAECRKPRYDENGYIHSFQFAVWAEDRTEGTRYNSNAAYVLKKDTVMYALWDETIEPITYTIEFDGNAGTAVSNVPASITTQYDTAVTLPDTEPLRTGFHFIGWNLRADGEGTQYQPGDSVINLTMIDLSTVKMYAQWKQKSFQVVKNASDRYGAELVKRTEGDDAWYDSFGKMTVEEVSEYPDEECVQVWTIRNDGRIERVG